MTRPAAWLLATLLLALSGCLTRTCPTPARMPCLTRVVCAKDARGCETCACEAAPQSRPELDQPGKRME